MGFNSGFKGLNLSGITLMIRTVAMFVTLNSQTILPPLCAGVVCYTFTRISITQKLTYRCNAPSGYCFTFHKIIIPQIRCKGCSHVTSSHARHIAVLAAENSGTRHWGGSKRESYRLRIHMFCLLIQNLK